MCHHIGDCRQTGGGGGVVGVVVVVVVVWWVWWMWRREGVEEDGLVKDLRVGYQGEPWDESLFTDRHFSHHKKLETCPFEVATLPLEVATFPLADSTLSDLS